MAVTVNPNEIVGDDIGNELIALQVDNSTYAPTVPALGTTLIRYGDLRDSKVMNVPTKSEKKNEKGQTRRVSYKHSLSISATIMQQGEAMLNHLASGVKNTTWLVFKYNGLINSLDQWYIMIGNTTPQLDITRPDNEAGVPFESLGIFPQSAITYTATLMASILALLPTTVQAFFPAVAVTIPVDDGYVLGNY